MEIKEKIDILNERLESIYQMLKLMNEYNNNADELEYTNYGWYFEIVYSYIKRYVVLEFFRMNDNSGADCISINKLKNYFIRNFDKCVSEKGNITLQEMKNRFSQIFTKEIREIETKIVMIRNKEGLAHGQEESFDTMVSTSEIEQLKVAYKDFLCLLCNIIGEEPFPFEEKHAKYYGLSELVKDLTHYEKKRNPPFDYMIYKGE